MISLELTKNLPSGIPERTKTRIKNDVGDFLVETIPGYLARAESPVAGEDWPKLSKEYKKKKVAEGLPGVANMELEGDMLDSLTFERTEDGIDLGFDGAEAAKADGHNHFSAASKNATAPRRRFLPGKGQEFVESIQKGIQQIVADAVGDEMEFREADFEDVSTKSELYSVLGEYFEGLSRSEIRMAISRAPMLARFLDDEGLFGLL